MVDKIQEYAEALRGLLGEKKERARATTFGLPALPGPRPSITHQTHWQGTVPSGGSLWQTLGCIEDVEGEWNIGRLYVGDRGLLFEGTDSEIFGSNGELMQWSAVERIEPLSGNEKLSPNEADKTVLVSVAGRKDPYLFIMVMPSDAEWLVETWHFFKRQVHKAQLTPDGAQVARPGDGSVGVGPVATVKTLYGDDNPTASMSVQIDEFAPQPPVRSLSIAVFEAQLPTLSLKEVAQRLKTEPFIFEAVFGDDMKCTQVTATKWVKSHSAQESKFRRIRFCKPLSAMQQTFAGVKEAEVTSMFRLIESEELEVLQKNTSQGPPYTDLFWVEVRTLFRPSNNGLHVQVFVKVVWIKKPWVPVVVGTVEAAAKDETIEASEALVRRLQTPSHD
jgi:hypothetical protein